MNSIRYCIDNIEKEGTNIIIVGWAYSEKDKKVNIYGPSKPYLERVNNRFYRKIMLKYKSRQDVENGLKNIFLLTFDSSKIKVDVDIDPIDNF